MRVRTILISMLLVVLSTSHMDLSAGRFATTAGQQIKDVGTAIKNIPANIRSRIDRAVSSYWGNEPSRDKVAKVRPGIGLSSGEKKSLIKRTEHSAAAIEKKFGKQSYTPKIAVLCSGGGYRAMFVTLGFLAGAQKSGLLDMVTWLAGVSGGTWGIGSVMAKAVSQDGTVDIAAFAQQQAQLLNNKPLAPSNKAEYGAIGNILMVQSIGHQLFTTVNLFGALLANRIFGFLPPEERQRQLISRQSSLIKSGAFPIPIYTVVQYDIGLAAVDYRWVEFNPWEFGGTWMHCYAPIWGNSRSYNNGISTNFHPERSFGFILGMCGSGFAAEFQDIYEKMKDGFYPFVRSIIEKSLLPRYATSRVTWGQLQNYSKDLSMSIIKDEQYLNLIDAGFACNVPYQPLSGQRPERKPDILIILDSSTVPLQSLRVVEHYAKKHNLKFPPIDYVGVDKRFISVFADPHDRDVPVVIYLLRMTDTSLQSGQNNKLFGEYAQWVNGFNLDECIKNDSCSFKNFFYTQQLIMQLVKTIEFQTIASSEVIFDVIKKVIDGKKKSWINAWKFW